MNHQHKIPGGGCAKYTEGTFAQIFDRDGKLIGQEFIASADCEYLGADGQQLDDDDPRCQFYHRFDC